MATDPKAVAIYEASSAGKSTWVLILDDGEVVKVNGTDSEMSALDDEATAVGLAKAALSKGSCVGRIDKALADELDGCADRIEEDNNFVHTTPSIDEVTGHRLYAVTDTCEKIMIRKDGSAPLLNTSDAAARMMEIADPAIDAAFPE